CLSGKPGGIGSAARKGIPRSVSNRLRYLPPMKELSQPTEKNQQPHMHSANGHDHSNKGNNGLISLESLLEPPHKGAVNIEELREKLAAGRGPQFWRTLEEAAESEELREYVEQEFPGLSG